MAVDELIEEITGKLGEEIHLSDWLHVDQKMINGFLALCGCGYGNLQPFTNLILAGKLFKPFRAQRRFKRCILLA